MTERGGTITKTVTGLLPTSTLGCPDKLAGSYLRLEAHPDAYGLVLHGIAALIALAATIALFRYKQNVIEVIAACALIVLILQTGSWEVSHAKSFVSS